MNFIHSLSGIKKLTLQTLFLLSISSMEAIAQETLSSIQPANINVNWQDWNLIIVTLDKDSKPNDKAELPLTMPVKIKKEKGPEITIQDYALENANGRLIKIQCGSTTITQKFDNTSQLKGWAIQMPCLKQDYYFIVNPVIP